jgi:anti-anti-sigma factor
VTINFNTPLTIQAIAPDSDQVSLCLKLGGHLTGDGIFILKQAVEPLFMSPTPPKLRLIMDDISYMDSSGVGIIISIIQKMRDIGGQLEIHGLSEVGRDLFQILKIASLHDVVQVKSQ